MVQTPAGFVALRLNVQGGEWFGTYVLRKAPGTRGDGAEARRAMRSFWNLAQAMVE